VEWVIHAIDRIRHAFFWKGTKNICGVLFNKLAACLLQ